jgi:ribonucleoside-diphosphate reductase alpha chain/ribonucleoside-diphosphate reductase subunit M1
MYVLKSGTREIVSFDKILRRIKTIGQEVGVRSTTRTSSSRSSTSYTTTSQPRNSTNSARAVCAVMASIHPTTTSSPEESRFPTTIKHEQQFSDVVKTLYENADNVARFIPSQKNYTTSCAETPSLSGLRLLHDYLIDYFGFKTLEKSYLIRKNRW